ncbi:MAG: hypothetical protein ACTHJ7_08395 [Candidatus Nitrosocosmicus sp.]
MSFLIAMDEIIACVAAVVVEHMQTQIFPSPVILGIKDSSVDDSTPNVNQANNSYRISGT